MKYPIVYQKGGEMTYSLFLDKFEELLWYKITFDKLFNGKWFLTGSCALMIHAYAYLEDEEFKNIPTPNDIDIIVRVTEDDKTLQDLNVNFREIDITYKGDRKIYSVTNGFKTKSATFTELQSKKSFDITKMSFSVSSITTIYGIPIISVQQLFNQYKDYEGHSSFKFKIMESILDKQKAKKKIKPLDDNISKLIKKIKDYKEQMKKDEEDYQERMKEEIKKAMEATESSGSISYATFNSPGKMGNFRTYESPGAKGDFRTYDSPGAKGDFGTYDSPGAEGDFRIYDSPGAKGASSASGASSSSDETSKRLFGSPLKRRKFGGANLLNFI